MAAGSASVDTMLADAISKVDALTKRMDALETKPGSRNPVKGDATKSDDDDDKKDDAAKADAKKADDDDDDKKDDAFPPKTKILDDDDDDDDDKKDDAFPPKKAKDDDGELEIKHKGKKDDSKKADAKKSDSKKADAKKADDDDDDDKKDSAKADDDDDKKDDDDDKKDDAAKADSISDLRRQIADQTSTIRRLEALMKPKSDEEHSAFADAQARADAVFNGFGQRAPRPLEGEDLIGYRKRLASKLKGYSPHWKNTKFRKLDDETFASIESQVYTDATAAASNPVDLEPGELREVHKRGPMGRETIEFYGKESFVKQMGRPGRRVQSFRTLGSI